jgi:uncharacterized protein DUF4386
MNSLSKRARLAGLLYILSSVVGALRLIYIPKALIVSGNPAATANNIASNELLFRLGIVSLLLGSVLWLLVPLALYRLLNEVDRTLAVLMVILGSIMQVPLFFMNAATDSAALLFAGGADFLAVFSRPQLDAFVIVFLNLHHDVDLANAFFWGLWVLPFGLLVYRSRFLPRILGVWLMIGRFGWLASKGMVSFAGDRIGPRTTAGSSNSPVSGGAHGSGSGVPPVRRSPHRNPVHVSFQAPPCLPPMVAVALFAVGMLAQSALAQVV